MGVGSDRQVVNQTAGGEDKMVYTPGDETPGSLDMGEGRGRGLAAEVERVNRQLSHPDIEKAELRRIKTLGEGPVAPVEAKYNALPQDTRREESSDRGGVQEEETMGVGRGEGGWVEPGIKGWLCCLGAFLANCMCYGMTNSFGVFQEYYTTTHPVRNLADATAISWIGSIQFCLCPLLGCIAGPLFDSGYLKSLIVAGGGLYVFSLMMTSIASQYWQILLAHGIGVGLGMGLFFSPSVSTLSHHFQRSKYRTVAYGLQATGSSIAGIIIPVMMRQLIPSVGFAWAMRILAFMVLGIVIVAFFTLSRVHPPRKKLALLSPTVFRNYAYTLYVLAGGLGSLAIYAPLTFGATYMRSQNFDPGLSFYAVAIGNGASIFGRIVPLIFAQKFGVINTMITFMTFAGIMLFLWTTAKTATSFLVYEAFYGVASGAYAACMNPGAASFAPHPNQAGLYLGMCFFSAAWFWLAGTPATAALIQGQTNYLPASMFCGVAVTSGAVCLTFSRWRRVKQVGTKLL